MVMPKKSTADPELFSGWKEIARYLRLGVRTVQRYERDLGLPIHRPAEKLRSGVIALKTELDDWISSIPTRATMNPSSHVAFQRFNRAGADFLHIDSEIALTFANLALETANPEKKQRTTGVARRAYDAITRLREGINLDETRAAKLDANLARLKNELQSLGQTF